MPKPFFSTPSGDLYVGDAAALLRNQALRQRYEGKCDLVFFSPPYSLVKQKSYKNKVAEEYIHWFKGFAKPLTKLLSPTGSIVIEMGNAWNEGGPTMATTPIEALLAFKKSAGLHLCQEFIWHNPARLPSPAAWVTVERIRLKDSWTRVWWLSPTPRPKASNQRVLQEYSPSMKALLKRQSYNAGLRPSHHRISEKSFLKDNGGAIPASALDNAALDSFIRLSNTNIDREYRQHCIDEGLPQHPARMPASLAAFFIALTTEPGDLVLDPFAGSNTTGATAESMGRRWLSFEMDEKFAAGSQVRFLGPPPADAPLLAGDEP